MSAALKGRIGLVTLIVLLVVSASYPLISQLEFLPACPFGQDVQFPLETVCARTIGGMWRSIVIGVVAGAIACAVALTLALLARFAGGTVDLLVEKSADLVFSIPDVLFLIAIAFAVNLLVDQDLISRPSSLLVMIASLAAVGWAAPARMIQNRLRSLERQEFVTAAVALGATRGRILVRHLLPFAWDYVVAIFLLRVPAIVLAESTVSFLGFSDSNEPSLGQYLGQNYSKLIQGNWQVVGPAWILLIALVLGFQWTGHGLLARADAKGRA